MKALTSPASHVKPVSHSAFDRWGRTAYRRRRLILVIALLVAVVGGVWGTTSRWSQTTWASLSLRGIGRSVRAR